MLQIGSLVDGKYKVLRVVGKGGMSVVYQAVNEKANKIWAIKEVRKDGVQNFEVVKQNLIVETELLKRFNHPNLPSIIDVIDTEDAFLIVMDYIEGNSLSKALEESGAQDQEDVVEWAMQLCDVLGYLHSRKPPIIYRDMKPANVMLKPDGNISLIDFGTAREFKSSSVEDTTCLGTQGYAAPEQYGGHGQTDARTDIYCLGATMYHLVTGHNPSMPPYEMYPIRQWDAGLSSGLEKIIIKCTQRNPADRYQSCAELLYDLEHYRDLDIENQKSQKKKWKTFITVMILAIVMGLGALACKIGEGMAKASTYDGLIAEAENAAQNPDDPSAQSGTEKYKTAVDLYARAIDLQPENTKAYSGLLGLYVSDSRNDLYLSDDEYESINAKIFKNEKNLTAENRNAYAGLAKELADAAFFSLKTDEATGSMVVDPNGYLHASNWYSKAINAGSSDEELNNKATQMKMIADCYNPNLNLGSVDSHGNVSTEVPELLETMKQVVENNDPNDNFVVSLRCFRVLTTLLYNRNNEFLVNNRDEYLALVDMIDEKVTAVENSGAYQNSVSGTGTNSYLKQLLEDTKKDIANIRKDANVDNTTKK